LSAPACEFFIITFAASIFLESLSISLNLKDFNALGIAGGDLVFKREQGKHRITDAAWISGDRGGIACIKAFPL
jgi:hypothetical protein